LKMLVVPRPIAWITTRRPDGVVNLAPFGTSRSQASCAVWQ